MRGQASANRHLKQALYTTAGSAGGAFAGLMFAALGLLAGETGRTWVGLAATNALLFLGLWEASGRRVRMLQFDRETPQRWMHLGPVRWPLVNGAALGFAVTTRLGFPLWYVLPMASFVSGTLWLSALLGMAYGLSRTSLAWAMLRHMSNRRPEAVLDALIRTQPLLRRAAGVLLAGDAAVVMAAVAL